MSDSAKTLEKWASNFPKRPTPTYSQRHISKENPNMEYLIIPPEATEWRINPKKLIEDLKKSWSLIELKIVTNSDDYYCLKWIIIVPETGQRIDGALHRDRQEISLDGYIQDCAAFAVWFRSLVSPSQKLLFYDQGFNSHIELQENMTE